MAEQGLVMKKNKTILLSHIEDRDISRVMIDNVRKLYVHRRYQSLLLMKIELRSVELKEIGYFILEFVLSIQAFISFFFSFSFLLFFISLSFKQLLHLLLDYFNFYVCSQLVSFLFLHSFFHWFNWFSFYTCSFIFKFS